LVVANGGPVIDPAEAMSLTEPFRRLTRDGGGFGLGLSIVRSVAEAHGGSVVVRAPESGGLEVTVELRALPAPAANVAAAQSRGALMRS
jgi:signal transduction histidine kinase